MFPRTKEKAEECCLVLNAAPYTVHRSISRFLTLRGYNICRYIYNHHRNLKHCVACRITRHPGFAYSRLRAFYSEQAVRSGHSFTQCCWAPVGNLHFSQTAVIERLLGFLNDLRDKFWPLLKFCCGHSFLALHASGFLLKRCTWLNDRFGSMLISRGDDADFVFKLTFHGSSVSIH